MRFGYLYSIFFLFAFITTSFICRAESPTPIILENPNFSFRLDKDFYYYEDIKNIEFENIFNKRKDIFHATSQRKFSNNLANSKHWIWFTIYNHTDEIIDLYVNLEHRFLYDIELYETSSEQIIKNYLSGISRKENTKLIKHRTYLYSIKLKPGVTKHIFLGVNNKGARFDFPISISDSGSFIYSDNTNVFVFSLIIGFLLFIAIYSYLNFHTAAQKYYQYFSLNIITSALLFITYEGFFHHIFFTNTPIIEYRLTFIFLSISCISLLTFSLSFFKFKVFDKVLYHIHLTAIFIGIILMIFSLMPTFIFFQSRLIILIGNMILIGVLCLSTFYYMRKNQQARYFSLAYTFSLVGMLLYILVDQKIIPNNYFTSNIHYNNYLITITLLFFFLAYKIGKDNKTKTALLIKQKEKISSKKEELQKAYVELEKSHTIIKKGSRLKSSILSNISHELKTPLNSIIGFSDIILKKKDLKQEKIEQFSRQINIQGKNVLERIDNILDTARLDSGYIETMNSDIDIELLCKELYDYFNVFVSTKEKEKIDFILDIHEGEHPIISSDRQIIRQVLVNIINNAIKFTKEGHIIFGYKTERTKLLFYIEDTGIGMTAEDVKAAFDQFRQLDGDINRRYSGMGIGLSLSQKLIHLIKGSIKIETNRTNGIKVWICIPYQE